MSNAIENLRSGDAVVARDWHWMIRGYEPGERCALLRVQRTDDEAPSLEAFLLPFERCHPGPATRRLRRASRACVARSLADLTPGPPGSLVSAARADFEVLPFQLAPALVMLSGASSRILIADEVGLGKTIQAGLVLHALRRRGLGDRCLLLVPASLGEQWRRELTERFHLSAECVDAARLRQRSSDMPSGRNVWRRTKVQVVSIDFARQLEVLTGLGELCWDVVVIDEAHHLAGRTARAAAARLLARRARHLLLLTATPHSGDERAFAALCELGRRSPRRLDPLVMFRRTRAVVAGAPAARRSRLVSVRETAAEMALFERLDRHARAVERGGSAEARLAMLVLRKRALSSPAALAASLRRRLDALDGPILASQLPLPIESDDDSENEAPVLAAPGPAPCGDERGSLRELLAVAEVATGQAAKARWLSRLLRRAGEPLVVFTEYRDTLDALAKTLSGVSTELLHGGLDPGERDRAIARFTNGEARLLLATDAAGEGLNLQARCRLVVHYELPWSPTRLEQRAGRVDRIGQRRRVHVWHLLGRHGAERRVLDRLRARASAIQRTLGSAAAWLAPELTAGSAPSPLATQYPGVVGGKVFEEEAAHEAAVLALARRLGPRIADVRIHGRAARSIPWIRLRPRHDRHLTPGILFVYATRVRALRCERFRAVHITLRSLPPGRAETWLAELAPLAASALGGDAIDRDDAWRARLVDRERALLAHLESRQRSGWQPALFDRRAARAAAASAERLDGQRREHRARLDRLEQDPGAEESRLVAVLVLE